MKNFESRNKPKVNELAVVKRLALQLMSTINGACGKHIDQYDVSVFRFSISKTHELLGAWNSPLPTTFKLLGLAREYADGEDNDPFIRAIWHCLHTMLRTLAVTPSPLSAAVRMDVLHNRLLEDMRPSFRDQVWFQGFRSTRIKDFRKVLAELD